MLEGVVRTMTMVENRMVVGEYYPDDPIADATAEDMAYFVADDADRIEDVLGSIDLCELWDNLPADYIAQISAAYVKRHRGAFADWMVLHGKV